MFAERKEVREPSSPFWREYTQRGQMKTHYKVSSAWKVNGNIMAFAGTYVGPRPMPEMRGHPIDISHRHLIIKIIDLGIVNAVVNFTHHLPMLVEIIESRGPLTQLNGLIFVLEAQGDSKSKLQK